MRNATAHKLTTARANIRAAANGGLRTGLSAMRDHTVAPVTVYVGGGMTSLPATMPQPVQHPEPKPDPLVAKLAAARAQAEAAELARQRRRNQRAAQRAAKAAARPVAAKRAPLRIAVCTFDNDMYVRSHGKAPRGRGTWCFCKGHTRTRVFFQHTGTLAEAKKAATAYAREQGFGTTATGCLRLYVCP